MNYNIKQTKIKVSAKNNPIIKNITETRVGGGYKQTTTLHFCPSLQTFPFEPHIHPISGAISSFGQEGKSHSSPRLIEVANVPYCNDVITNAKY